VNVYNLAGEKLGSVEDIMIDKSTGRSIYAVMSFGGFLGMAEKHHPLPWATLRYHTQKGGDLATLTRRC
jgi:sporulation protein YlmC with PRC-barrel domain